MNARCQLDPRFALAWVGLGRSPTSGIAIFPRRAVRKPSTLNLTAAREAVDKALTIEPDLPEALYARAVIETNFDYNLNGAAKTCTQSSRRGPTRSGTASVGGKSRWISRVQLTQALEFCRRSVAVDPVNPLGRQFLAVCPVSLGTPRGKCSAEYAREIEVDPSAPNSYAAMGLTYVLEGKFEEALVAAQKDAAGWARLLVVSCARWGQKRSY